MVELRICVGGRRPRPFAREGADVQFVDHLARQRHAVPAYVGPFEGARIDDLRWAVRAWDGDDNLVFCHVYTLKQMKRLNRHIDIIKGQFDC